jgi:hypothetical protein
MSGCENWSLTLKKEHRRRMSEKGVEEDILTTEKMQWREMEKIA